MGKKVRTKAGGRPPKTSGRVTESPCKKHPRRVHSWGSKVSRRIDGEIYVWSMCSWCGSTRPIGHRRPYPPPERSLVEVAETRAVPGADLHAGALSPAVDGVLPVP